MKIGVVGRRPKRLLKGIGILLVAQFMRDGNDMAMIRKAILNTFLTVVYATDPRYLQKVLQLLPQAADVLDMSLNGGGGNAGWSDQEEATWFSLDLGADREPIIYVMSEHQRISSLKSIRKREIIDFLARHEQANTLRLSNQIKVLTAEQQATLRSTPLSQVTWFQFWRGTQQETILVGMADGVALNALVSSRVDTLLDFMNQHDRAATVQASNLQSKFEVGVVATDNGHPQGGHEHEGSRDALLRPNIEWVSGCRNFSSRSGQGIDAIVVHYTTSRNVDGSIAWFCNPESRVSAHYIVGRDGKIFQLVKDSDKAWHCYRFNTTSIGIEHVAAQGDKLTPKQEKATIQLIRWLCAEYKISTERIIGHRWNPQDPNATACPGELWTSKEALRNWVAQHITGIHSNVSEVDTDSEPRHAAAEEAIPKDSSGGTIDSKCFV